MLVEFPTLLVVDDDRYILRFLRMNLERDGFEVLVAATALEALDQLERGLPDLAIVDLLLPDMHGFELCRQIKSYVDLPVIVLTAVGTEESTVEGLEQYAEDYMVKPFRYRELLARVKRVMKRTRQLLPQRALQALGRELCLDFARHRAIVNGREVRLTPTESRLLACLARSPNRVVGHERLMDEVWPDGEGDPLRLKVAVRRIRAKIEDDPARPRYLLTHRGEGYSLVVPE